MAPPPLSTGVPQATPTLPPPPFPGVRPPPPFLSDKPGLCGLTGHEWHLVMILIVPTLVVILFALIVSWLTSTELSFLWLRAQQHAKMTRMGLRERLFGHLLSEEDIRSGRIVTGPNITPPRYPTVDFVARLFAPSSDRREP